MIRRKQIWNSGIAGSFALTDDGTRLAKRFSTVVEKLFAEAVGEGFSVREVAHLIVTETGSIELLNVLRLRVDADERRMGCARRTAKRGRQGGRR